MPASVLATSVVFRTGWWWRGRQSLFDSGLVNGPRYDRRVVDGVIACFIMVVGDAVEQVYADAGHRGHDVAQRLASTAEQQVADNGFREAWLAVVASNVRARTFYTRAGWSDNGLFDYQAYGEEGLITVPAHRYTKLVGPRPGSIREQTTQNEEVGQQPAHGHSPISSLTRTRAFHRAVSRATTYPANA